MPEFEQEEFKFPDEQEAKPAEVEQEEDKFELEIEDDTPPEDRGREPMPKEIVQTLEKDELDQYEGEVKEKLKQMRKVWHDERRAKEEAAREREEAVTLAKRVMEENKRIREMYQSGGEQFASTLQGKADLELQMAKKAYKEAYDSGDTDAIVEAQQAMQEATLRAHQAKNFKIPPLQEENFDVQIQNEQNQPVPRPDEKLVAWQNRNTWFGQDEEMTAAALGLHEKLKRTGVVVGSDEYYATLDKTIRKRFPENFESEEPPEPKAKQEAKPKPSTVVAPATRSTSPNKIRLKASQVQLAKKLGLTPEQYALELRKLEA